MSSELIINYRHHETRVALLEYGSLVEFQIERSALGAGLLGNIYYGKVLRILPGMQAAFIDIGLEKAAFLYVDDIYNTKQTFEKLLGPPQQTDYENEEYFKSTAPSTQAIETLIKQGDEILVQISKEPIGQKGARITSHISLPSRRLVLMPMVEHFGISRRILDEEERKRLKNILENLLPNSFGFIARTAAEGAENFELKAEANFLTALWQKILNKEQTSTPMQVHQELDATLKSVRDLVTENVKRVIVDNNEQFIAIKNFLNSFSPDLAHNVELYKEKTPIFEYYNIETDLERALSKKVWLKSGGYIVIESTEALTVIDINTGRYVGRHNLEDTIFKTNMEAVKEITYQLRLRNIGGLIVVDFIDMEEESNREKITLALLEALKNDKGKIKVLPMSEFGLIEMTRKRTRENIDRFLRKPCFYCQGQGFLLSCISICYQALRDLEHYAAENSEGDFQITVFPKIKDVFLDEARPALADLENRINRNIIIKTDEQFHIEQYLIKIKKN